ncbi:MAG: hypothetical protein IT548_18545 [Alphaproteobacteria bacterium]|nr:hypothetical protein [Alphaproteobacteria bacterium]
MQGIDHRALATWPEKGSGLGVGSWFRESVRLAKWSAFPPSFPERGALPRGNGEGVLVIPGFLTGDGTTVRLRTFLWGLGYRAEGWRAGRNLGPRSRAIERLKTRVARLADQTGGKVAVAGVSLGGVFAREVARMMPDHVCAVATMCSPARLPIPTPLAPFVWALQRSFDPGLVAGVMDDVQMPPQKMLALYSREDGIVDWRTCVPPESDTVTAMEIDGARHSTIGSTPRAQAALAHFLARAFD